MTEPKSPFTGNQTNYEDLDPETKKAGKRLAIWIVVGIFAWAGVYVAENQTIISSLLFWSIVGVSTLLGVVIDLVRADFNLLKISWAGKAWDSAYNQDNELRTMPKIGMSIGLVIVNFLAHGYLLILLILCLNFIPKGDVYKKEVKVYKMETSSSRGSSYTTYYFRWDDTKEHFMIPSGNHYFPDSLKFRTYNGFFGLPVLQRRLG